MEKKINLEDVLFNSKFNDLTLEDKQSIKNGIICFSFEEILSAMKEACRQTLELAAENARCDAPYGVDVSHMISKQSILDTINQIEL